jgi:hypothetical protein
VPDLTHNPGLVGLALVPDWRASQLGVFSLWRDEACALAAGAVQCCQASASLLAGMILTEAPVQKYSLT